MTKELVENVMKDLPDEFDAEVLIEKLTFMMKVERGLKDAREGRTKTLEEAKAISKTWSK